MRRRRVLLVEVQAAAALAGLVATFSRVGKIGGMEVVVAMGLILAREIARDVVRRKSFV